jgi:signal transduction histidine kinase
MEIRKVRLYVKYEYSQVFELKIVPKLLIGFLAVVIPTLCIESISIFELNQIEKPVSDLQTNTETLQNALELNDLTTDIKYYDEVLTQSARNYAFTQDITWKERYKASEPELDRIIKRSIEIGDKNTQKFFANIDNANLALVKMEYDSIELVDQDRTDEAIKILESKQYWDLKKIYLGEFNKYAAEHVMQKDMAFGTHEQSIGSLGVKIQSLVGDTTKMLIVAIPIVLISSIIFTLIVSKHISKPINKLVESVTKVAAGEFGIEIKIKGNDEIHVLAESFNMMSKQLKGYTRKIELDRLKDEFMAMISHELKTPLVPITGYTDLLLMGKYGKLTNTQREKMLIIQTSTKSLLSLMADLLDAQKIELGKLRLDIKDENLDKILLDIVKKIEPSTSKSGIKITTDLQNNLQCFCDKNRVVQAISNILLNSIDFCPESTGKIHVTAKIQDNFAKIIVKDNGIGMTKEKIENLFTKFYQGDTTTTREHGGTGLGLAVCKGIVETHGGKIWVESEGIGKGIEVHIQLPLITNQQTLIEETV